MSVRLDTFSFLQIEKMFACFCTFSQPRFPSTFAGRKDAHSSSHFFTTGGSSTTLTGDPTKRVKVCADIWSDQLDVPVVQHGKRLSQEPHILSRPFTKQLPVHDESFGSSRQGLYIFFSH